MIDQCNGCLQVSVWAPAEQIEQGRFALEVGVKVLAYYEKIFDVKYPLPKQGMYTTVQSCTLKSQKSAEPLLCSVTVTITS